MQIEARRRARKGGPRGLGRPLNGIATVQLPSPEGYITSILTKIFELLRYLCDVLSVSCTQDISASV